MFYKNPNSRRINVFRKMFDSDRFKNVLSYKGNLHKFPFWSELELTNNCNLRCLFCGQQAMTRPRGYMTEETLKKIVDECAEYQCNVQFCRWGEPFLHKNIIDFAEYVKIKDLPLLITNNGTVITENHMEAIVELGVDWIIFSFQGATKEKYELMRNNKMYDKLCNNIHKLIEIRGSACKPFIHISNSITDETKDEVDQFIKKWGNVVDSIGFGKTNLCALPVHQMESKEIAKKLIDIRDKQTLERTYKPCTEIYTKLSVDWDGKVSCCCDDFDNFLTVGDLNETTLYNIWNTSRRLSVIRWMLGQNMHKHLTHCSTCYHIYSEF